MCVCAERAVFMMPLVVGSVCACEVCVVFMIEQLAVCTEQTNTRLRL